VTYFSYEEIYWEGWQTGHPASYRKALGLREGDEVIVLLEADGVRILTVRQALQGAQKLVRQYVPAGRFLARELIAQRREDARRG
jgi:bifunctional DNA-binding transcriptional regulator/antitoxin component of YhaV-PrlF toxin-antitoxin module